MEVGMDRSVNNHNNISSEVAGAVLTITKAVATREVDNKGDNTIIIIIIIKGVPMGRIKGTMVTTVDNRMIMDGMEDHRVKMAVNSNKQQPIATRKLLQLCEVSGNDLKK